MPIKLCVQALVTALRVYGENRHSSVSLLEEVHFINFDVNVVVEAIFSCEEILKTETAETAVNRMEDGKKLYGKRVFPYCLRFVFLFIFTDGFNIMSGTVLTELIATIWLALVFYFYCLSFYLYRWFQHYV